MSPVLESLPLLLRIGGALQLVIVVANGEVARQLDYRRNLAGASLMVRQIFWVHLGWILASLLVCAGMDLLFPEALAGASPLGRYLSGVLAVLWTLRVGAQQLLYDRAVRSAHRVADVVFSCFFLYLAVVHGIAAVAAPLSAGVSP